MPAITLMSLHFIKLLCDPSPSQVSSFLRSKLGPKPPCVRCLLHLLGDVTVRKPGWWQGHLWLGSLQQMPGWWRLFHIPLLPPKQRRNSYKNCNPLCSSCFRTRWHSKESSSRKDLDKGELGGDRCQSTHTSPKLCPISMTRPHRDEGRRSSLWFSDGSMNQGSKVWVWMSAAVYKPIVLCSFSQPYFLHLSYMEN